MTDRVQDSERPWETIEAAFRRCTRALKESTEAEQRLSTDRDSSEREAGRVLEESIEEINDAIRRIKEIEASADEVVGQLAPLRGRRWDAPEVIPHDGIPRERLHATLQDCEVAVAELTRAATEYPIARKQEVNKSTRNVLLIVFVVGIVLFLLCIMVCCSSAGIQSSRPSSLQATSPPSSVDQSDRISDSAGIVPPAVSRTTGTTTDAHTPATATPSMRYTATATRVSPSPIPSRTRTPNAAAQSGYDTSTCSQSVGPTFRTLWARHRAALGCPLEPQHGLITAYQEFQHGYMIYRADQPDKGYVLFDDGTWQGHSAEWRDGRPEYSCPDDSTPATTPPTPRRGFGFVWCHDAVVRERLGWATMDEVGNWRNFQSFEGGWAIELDQVPNSPMMVLLDDGSWQ